MTVALADFGFAIGLMGQGAGFEFAGPGAEAHGATHLFHAKQFAEFVDHAMGSLRIALRGVRIWKRSHIPGVFDCGALHAKANSKIGDFVLARELDGVNHALEAALAEAAGNEDAVVALEALFGGFEGVDFFGFDPIDYCFVMVSEAAV